MLGLALNLPTHQPLKVLCLGAHCDDIEIGCGGTILKLGESDRQVQVHWAVMCSNETRAREATASADQFLRRMSEKQVLIKDFKDGFLPYLVKEVKEFFEEIKTGISPDLIFTHYRNDLHQDHRIVSELTWNTFRNHLILEYEIPKYDGDLGQPNFFAPLPSSICEEKAKILQEAFVSQRTKPWFTKELFLAMLRLRGMESASPTQYAEAFYSRKVCLG